MFRRDEGNQSDRERGGHKEDPQTFKSLGYKGQAVAQSRGAAKDNRIHLRLFHFPDPSFR